MDQSVPRRRGRLEDTGFKRWRVSGANLLSRIWTALMLKRVIRFVESSHERDCREFNLNKAEVLAALRCLHDEVVDGPPLPNSQHAPIDDDQAKPTTTMW